MIHGDAGRAAPGRIYGLRSACPPGPFTEVVHRLAASHQVPPVWVSRRGRAAAAQGGRRAHVVASAALLKEPAEIQEWSAAHEMGHVVLGHHLVDGLPRSLPWILLGAAMLGAAILSPPPPQVWIVWTVAAVLAFAELGCVLTSFASFALRVQRYEVEADSFARDCGYPITPQVAAWLAEAEPKLLQISAYRRWRTHPLPANRQH